MLAPAKTRVVPGQARPNPLFLIPSSPLCMGYGKVWVVTAFFRDQKGKRMKISKKSFGVSPPQAAQRRQAPAAQAPVTPDGTGSRSRPRHGSSSSTAQGSHPGQANQDVPGAGHRITDLPRGPGPPPESPGLGVRARGLRTERQLGQEAPEGTGQSLKHFLIASLSLVCIKNGINCSG